MIKYLALIALGSGLGFGAVQYHDRLMPTASTTDDAEFDYSPLRGCPDLAMQMWQLFAMHALRNFTNDPNFTRLPKRLVNMMIAEHGKQHACLIDKDLTGLVGAKFACATEKVPPHAAETCKRIAAAKTGKEAEAIMDSAEQQKQTWKNQK